MKSISLIWKHSPLFEIVIIQKTGIELTTILNRAAFPNWSALSPSVPCPLRQWFTHGQCLVVDCPLGSELPETHNVQLGTHSGARKWAVSVQLLPWSIHGHCIVTAHLSEAI